MKKVSKRMASMLVAVCLLMTAGLSSCSKPVELVDVNPVLKAVDQLYSEAASVPVQYGAYDYILYMLNSNHEAQAESATMQAAEDGSLVSVNSADRFSKIYLSSQDVIYFDAGGGVSYGPETSPIDFVQATAKMYQTGKSDISVLTDPVDETTQVYKFTIPSIDTYEAIYAQRDAEMAKKMVESMRTLESSYTTGSGASQVETEVGSTQEPADTAESVEPTPTESPAAGDSDKGMSFELQVYVGETVPEFQAYMNYDIQGDKYVGWYIGGCFPVADWGLSEDWYQPIDTYTAEEWTDKYNELIDEINDLITNSTAGVDLNIGISLADYFAMDDTERSNVINRVDEALSSSGYSYVKDKNVNDLKLAVENGFGAYTEDTSTDIMQAARVAGVANGVIVDTKGDVVQAGDGDTINGEPGATTEPSETSQPEEPITNYSTAAYIKSNDREGLMQRVMDYWQNEGYTVGCTPADLVQLASDIGIRETADNLVDEMTPAALEKGYIVQ